MTATVTHDVLDSPLGPITVVARDGALSGLFADHRRGPALDQLGRRCPPDFTAVREQIGEYFAGTRRHFELPVAPVGTAFQQHVWATLCRIPFGQTWSYGELAARVGRAGAARAVGHANARNPMSLVVPCHRVVGADGRLTGYGGGVERKRFLLDLEQRTGTTRAAT